MFTSSLPTPHAPPPSHATPAQTSPASSPEAIGLIAVDALVRPHTRRWPDRGLSGALSDPAVVAAHREAAPLLDAVGLLRLYAMRLDGQIIAVLYCLAEAAPRPNLRHYDYLGGFDPRFASLSPGTLLIAHAIERASDEGATAFDFLRGRDPYKYRWGARDQSMYTLRLWHGGSPAAECRSEEVQ